MRFRNQIAAAVESHLEQRNDATAFGLFTGDRTFRRTVVDAVWERFREDEPRGGLIALLQWIADHPEEIAAIVKLIMTLLAVV